MVAGVGRIRWSSASPAGSPSHAGGTTGRGTRSPVRRNEESGDQAGVDTVRYIRHHDEYRRIGTEWKFTRRALHLRWAEERPATIIA
jgi:hypothetical protein